MHELMKKYPGTVIAVVDKSNLAVELKAALAEFEKPLHEKLQIKLETYGPRVTCCTDYGYCIEGEVIEILPFNNLFIDCDEPATFVVRTPAGRVSHWRPSFVTFIGKK